MGFHHDAEGCSESERAVGADAVVGDNLGRVLGAGAGDAPQSGAGGTETFADSEHKPAGDQDGQAEPCGIAMEGCRTEQKHNPLAVQAAIPQSTEIFAPL